MLHLLQLEHYENARLFVWLRRRGELADRSTVVAVVLALVAVGAAAAHGAADRAARRDRRPLGALAPGFAARAARRRSSRWCGPSARGGCTRPRWRCPAVVLLIGVVLTIALGSDLPFAIAGALAVAAVGGCAWVLAGGQRGAGAGPAPDQRPLRARRRPTSSPRSTRVVIGITGSYGKTTTKVCIGAVLSSSCRR